MTALFVIAGLVTMFAVTSAEATVTRETEAFENKTAAFAAGAMSTVNLVLIVSQRPSRPVGLVGIASGAYVALRDEGSWSMRLGLATALLGLGNLAYREDSSGADDDDGAGVFAVLPNVSRGGAGIFVVLGRRW